MRVLHVLRRDHAQHIGGDLVQLRAFVDVSLGLGIEAYAGSVEDATAPPDIVHYYNLERTGEMRRSLATARARWPAVRTVISPVFWPAPTRDILTGYGWRARDRALRYAMTQRLRWRTQRWLLGQADAICPGTELEATRQASWFRIDRDNRWVIVANGLTLAQWPARSATPERRATLAELGLDPGLDLLVACVARIEARKNQLALVEAMRSLPGAGLALVGPSHEAGYAKAVRSSAGAGRVALIGPRDAGALARLLWGVDVHVLPSLQEIPGLATLEAAAAGCEVVVTPGGSAASYLGGLGHVARSTRPKALAAEIRSAVTGPTQPQLRRHIERYDWTAAGDALRRAYERAQQRINPRRAHRPSRFLMRTPPR